MIPEFKIGELIKIAERRASSQGDTRFRFAQLTNSAYILKRNFSDLPVNPPITSEDLITVKSLNRLPVQVQGQLLFAIEGKSEDEIRNLVDPKSELMKNEIMSLLTQLGCRDIEYNPMRLYLNDGFIALYDNPVFFRFKDPVYTATIRETPFLYSMGFTYSFDKMAVPKKYLISENHSLGDFKIPSDDKVWIGNRDPKFVFVNQRGITITGFVP